jgi:hypothetical protein
MLLMQAARRVVGLAAYLLSRGQQKRMKARCELQSFTMNCAVGIAPGKINRDRR